MPSQSPPSSSERRRGHEPNGYTDGGQSIEVVPGDSVPLPYVINTLHSLGPAMSRRIDSADCTIVIPLPSFNLADAKTNASRLVSCRPSNVLDPIGSRCIDSSVNPTVTYKVLEHTLTYRLHRDYLTAQSSLLRGYLPADLLAPPFPTATIATGASKLSKAVQIAPQVASRGTSPSAPRWAHKPSLLPESREEHPVVLLPLPDPSSFSVILHYFYHGDLQRIQTALDTAEVRWDGLIANADALQLSKILKEFLARWWKVNVAPITGPTDAGHPNANSHATPSGLPRPHSA